MQEKVIISTDECYEGKNIKEDYYEVGSYSDLFDNSDIDNNTIEWSSTSWDNQLEYFNDILEFEKNKYEKRYNTEVLELALCGNVGTWRGRCVGGKIVSFKNPVSMGDVDSIDVTMDIDRTIFINGHHHDGSHSMALYFLTESSMKRAGILNTYQCSGTKYFEAEDFEAIYNNLNPIKLSKNNEYCSL